MKKKNNTEPQYVTKEILKQELTKSEKRLTGKIGSLDSKIDTVEKRLDAKIDGVEQRLDAKIDAKVDSAVQSMKDYTDSRFNQLDTKLNQRFDKVEHYFEELTGMFVQQNKKIDTSLKQLKNHEQRITKLEEQKV